MENSPCSNNSCSGWERAVRAWQQQREIHGLIYLWRDLPKASLSAYCFPSACFPSSTPPARGCSPQRGQQDKSFASLPFAEAPTPCKTISNEVITRKTKVCRYKPAGRHTHSHICLFWGEGPNKPLLWQRVLQEHSGCCSSDFPELLGTIYCISHEPWLL